MDVDRDGRAEVIAVSAHPDLGARLEVWGSPNGAGDGPRHAFQLFAVTPYIGTCFRRLAPAGVAGFDGDGRVDIAYVDRPHSLGDLVLVRLVRDLGPIPPGGLTAPPC